MALKQRSPAEFFAENKNIAGFDNPGKSLYTTVRELVENGVDSAEGIGCLPWIQVTVEEISKTRFNTIMGLDDFERTDEALYHDFETKKQKDRREAKEAMEQEKIRILEEKQNLKGAEAAKATFAKSASARKRKGTMYYKVVVKDNGSGMSHEHIPDMLGKVLSGTKYSLKQTRGKFGLGAKMALIWSKMSTGLPFTIMSAQEKKKYISHYVLDIDMYKNVPHIHKEEKLPNDKAWRGSEIAVTIEGDWIAYRARLLSYLRQMAVITPYAQFDFHFLSEDPEKSFGYTFKRRTDTIPDPPKETKYHPSAVDLMVFEQLLSHSKSNTLVKFLQNEFLSINKTYAERLIAEMGPDFDPLMHPSELKGRKDMLVRMQQLFKEAKFSLPDGSCLSPVGEYNLRLGIIKELDPDMVSTYRLPQVQVFEGHPFIVEAGVSVGGKTVKPGLNIYRFANRIPLLFEKGGDVVTRVANSISWGNYKITKDDRVGVFVSVVSTRIPYKGAGKEYIGADIKEYVCAVKQAIQGCAVQLSKKISRKDAAKAAQERKGKLVKYIPDVSRAIVTMLSNILKDSEQPEKKRRITSLDAGGILGQLQKKELSEAILSKKLVQHVQQIDVELALEYAAQTGMASKRKSDVFINPTTASQVLGPELHASKCVIRLLH